VGALLDKIASPEDLKKLSVIELAALCLELREYMTDITLKNGGHLASNLGAVEITTALHYLYDFKTDRLVFDVGHQCYTHKILTGRRDAFKSVRTFGGISGYPDPEESPFDCFHTGHASTSISMASGLAEAYARQGVDRRVVAFVGDGSLTGGEAYEGLCHLGSTQRDVLVVLNDNRMAISPSTGGMTRYLTLLRTSQGYNEFKKEIHSLIGRLPLMQGSLAQWAERLHNRLSAMMIESGIFATLGYKYFGPCDGHNVPELVAMLREVRKLRRPVLLHVVTEKGKGNHRAECDPITFHGVGPSVVEQPTQFDVCEPNFTDVFGETIAALGEKDEKLVALTAAMCTGTGVSAFAAKFPDRTYDVGIAEPHCVTFAASMARGGLKPVVAIYSTFMMRAVDQVFHDVILQKDIPLLVCMDRAGLVGEDGATHHGLYDISVFKAFPGIVMCSPADVRETVMMIKWAIDSGRVVLMRYPRAKVPKYAELPEVPPVELGRGYFVREGKDVCIIAYGAMLRNALDAAAIIESEGHSCAVANPRFALPLDLDLIKKAAKSHLVVTVEEHSERGGFGSLVSDALPTSRKFLAIGVPDRLIPHGSRRQLLELCGLDAKSIAQRVIQEIRA